MSFQSKYKTKNIVDAVRFSRKLLLNVLEILKEVFPLVDPQKLVIPQEKLKHFQIKLYYLKQR